MLTLDIEAGGFEQEKEPKFSINLPAEGEGIAVAKMHIQSWKETYVNQDSGLTEEKVDEMLQHLLDDTTFRENTFKESLENPEQVFYRVVKNEDGEVVGFFHGSKHEDFNELDAIYLLDEAKGSGTGGKLMEEFLAWVDKAKITRLEAFSFNDSAIGFYERYGFSVTDKEMELFRGMPVVEMVRPAEEAEATV